MGCCLLLVCFFAVWHSAGVFGGKVYSAIALSLLSIFSFGLFRAGGPERGLSAPFWLAGALENPRYEP
jgi:hypothetical protein